MLRHMPSVQVSLDLLQDTFGERCVVEGTGVRGGSVEEEFESGGRDGCAAQQEEGSAAVHRRSLCGVQEVRRTPAVVGAVERSGGVLTA
ncbi:hypothetical protein ABT236_24520 [Streptomyces sp. NPDC001523]|uniref:hypothetical protein n=1 Tax=Streptomyces sp. NPDC001523 TaxID=3154383 RepID=UPI0033295335